MTSKSVFVSVLSVILSALAAAGCAAPTSASSQDSTGVENVESTSSALLSAAIPVTRAWNGTQHFYTTSYAEAVGAGFGVEAAAYFYVSGLGDGLAPLYRCYIPSIGRHFYTQAANCEGAGYSEGPLGLVANDGRCGATPLYRMYNGALQDHFYTTSAAEVSSASAGGWGLEGIAGWVWLSPTAC
jgi:hypothetical protein